MKCLYNVLFGTEVTEQTCTLNCGTGYVVVPISAVTSFIQPLTSLVNRRPLPLDFAVVNFLSFTLLYTSKRYVHVFFWEPLPT